MIYIYIYIYIKKIVIYYHNRLLTFMYFFKHLEQIIWHAMCSILTSSTVFPSRSCGFEQDDFEGLALNLMVFGNRPFLTFSCHYRLESVSPRYVLYANRKFTYNRYCIYQQRIKVQKKAVSFSKSHHFWYPGIHLSNFLGVVLP